MKNILTTCLLLSSALLLQAKPKEKKEDAPAPIAPPASFTTNCAACHLLDRDGIAPSLIELAKLYKKDDTAKFVQWCIDPGKKRNNLPQMPSMAHVGKEELANIHDYILKGTKGVKEVKVRKLDRFAKSPVYTKRPRLVRTFLPETGPASLIIALPTKDKHNLVWDTALCQFRYLTTGETDNWPYLKSNGNSLAKPGEIIYRSSSPIFNSKEAPTFLGYRFDEKGFPTLLYKIDGVTIHEKISSTDDHVIRVLSTTDKADLPAYTLPKKEDAPLKVEASFRKDSLTIIYSTPKS